jgi:hypothetical protein
VVGVDVGVGVDVLYDRRDPQRRDAELANVVEVLLEPLPITPLVARERPGLHLEVVVHIAVGETVDEHLIDDLVAPIFHIGLEARARRTGGQLDTPRRERGDAQCTPGDARG